MKKVLMVSMCVVATLAGHADPIDIAEAQNVATRVLAANKGKKVEVVRTDLAVEVKNRMAISPVASPAFYTFNADDGEGFVIVSGDDDFPAVIGYSDSGSITSTTTMPPALVDYLETYSCYVRDVRSGTAYVPDLEQMNFAATAPVVSPLCNSKWGQDDPFNAYCPLDKGERSLVGCTATAMAQIMYKWKFPERARGVVKYNSGLGIINEDMNSDTHVYDWVSMKPSTAGNRTASAKKAVAQLNYDCGIAAKMQYGADGSGAYEEDAMIAFRENFFYNAATMDLIHHDCFANQSTWNAVLYDELVAGRPVLFSASSSTGAGGDAAGHAFVVDGCDAEGLVHVNWGWNGDCDGYYDVTRLDPKGTGYKFTETQTMVIGITPGTGDEAVPQTKLVLEDVPVCRVTSKKLGLTFDVNVLNMYSRSNHRKIWTVNIGLFNKDGELLEMIAHAGEKENTFSLDGWYGYEKYPISCVIPTTYTDGDYALRVMIRQGGYNEWILPDVVGGENRNWIPVHIVSRTARFNEVSTSVKDVLYDTEEIVARQYFDFSGGRVMAPVKGQTVIEVITLDNGERVRIKRVF